MLLKNIIVCIDEGTGERLHNCGVYSIKDEDPAYYKIRNDQKKDTYRLKIRFIKLTELLEE